MSRGPARFKQCDLARAIRAAQATGAAGVKIAPDGSIFVSLQPTQEPSMEAPEQPAVAVKLW